MNKKNNNSKSNNTKNKRIERINIRTTTEEKNKLKKKAKDRGMDLSEYILCSGLSLHIQSPVYLASIMQEVCNYIEEKYGEDKYLEKVNEELWKSF